jgi:hypothetical protein
MVLSNWVLLSVITVYHVVMRLLLIVLSRLVLELHPENGVPQFQWLLCESCLNNEILINLCRY